MGCGDASNAKEPRGTFKYTDRLRKKYSLQDCIGYNSFTGLFTATLRDTGEHVWVRSVNYTSQNFEKLEKRAKSLVTYQPSFPNLIHIKEVGKTSSHFYFVMKKDPKARNILEAIFSNEVEIMEITLRLMLFPLMKTLCKMHQKKIHHGQINPHKIMFYNNDCYLFDPCAGIEQASELISENYTFLAPEVFNGEEPSEPSDVWALGASLYYIIVGQPIFITASSGEFSKKIRNSTPAFVDSTWNRASADLKNLLSQMLKKSKEERITMNGVLKHPWIESALAPKNGESPVKLSGGNYTEELQNLQIRTKCLNLLANELTAQGLQEFREQLQELDIHKRKQLLQKLEYKFLKKQFYHFSRTRRGKQ